MRGNFSAHIVVVCSTLCAEYMLLVYLSLTIPTWGYLASFLQLATHHREKELKLEVRARVRDVAAFVCIKSRFPDS